MKNNFKIISILLAFVVVILSVATLKTNEAQPSTTSDEDIILNSIMTRTSVRSYTNEPIDAASIEKILKAGMSAPSAGNRQPWEIYVVSDTTIIRQMNKVTRYSSKMSNHALTAMVVCGDPAKSFPKTPDYWVQDCSAVTENILLATHALGLGATWCGVYPVDKQVKALQKLLDMPEGLIPLNIIMMGHPAGEQTVKDKWKPQKVHYVKGK